MQIERRANLPYGEFIENYSKPQKPVILTDAAKDWVSAKEWTPKSLKERFGSRVFEIDGVPRTFGNYLDQVMESTADDPAPYFCNVELISNFPELHAEVPYFRYAEIDRAESRFLPRKFMEPGWYELFIGGPGGQFPFLHSDFKGVFSWITQLYGEKECVFFSPEQREYLYPRTDNHRRSHINPFDPDTEKYPLFENANPIRCVLRPGESLFVAPDWWHSTRMLSASITVASSHITSTNWKNFIRDEWITREGRRSRIPVCAYLYLVGALLSIRERAVTIFSED